jgi:peptidoglycan/xylan/chitin deacetylase (PgdA/CDA1 family)
MRLPPFLRSKRRRLAKLAAVVRENAFSILLFHSIGRPAEAEFLPPALNCPADFFEAVLRMLSQEGRLVPLSEIVRGRARRGSVAVTFDDGFRDNFTVALPLLRKYGAAATIFVATDAIGAEELLPIHRYYYLRRYAEFTLLLPALSVDGPDRRRFAEEFCARNGLSVPRLGRTLYLGWEELRQMADAGVEVAAHTRSHPWLAALPLAEQRQEILSCKQLLEQQLGRPVTGFAYPYGYRDSFTAETAAIVAENFGWACLSVPGVDTAFDPLALPRINVAGFLHA